MQRVARQFENEEKKKAHDPECASVNESVLLIDDDFENDVYNRHTF